MAAEAPRRFPEDSRNEAPLPFEEFRGNDGEWATVRGSWKVSVFFAVLPVLLALLSAPSRLAFALGVIPFGYLFGRALAERRRGGPISIRGGHIGPDRQVLQLLYLSALAVAYVALLYAALWRTT